MSSMSIEEMDKIADAVVNKLKLRLNSIYGNIKEIESPIGVPENKTLPIKGKVNYLSSDNLEVYSEDTDDPNKINKYFMKVDCPVGGSINVDVTNCLPTLGQVLFIIPEQTELWIYSGSNKLKTEDWHLYDDYKVIKLRLNWDLIEITIEDRESC